jgi:hypothetical protein
VDCRGAEHGRRPAPAATAFAMRPHETPDDDGSVLRVEPALELALRSVDGADRSPCSEDTHIRVSRIDGWSPSDISQSHRRRPGTRIHDPFPGNPIHDTGQLDCQRISLPRLGIGHLVALDVGLSAMASTCPKRQPVVSGIWCTAEPTAQGNRDSPGRWRCGGQFSASNSIAVSRLCNVTFRSANPTCSNSCDDPAGVTATVRGPAEPDDASPVRHRTATERTYWIDGVSAKSLVVQRGLNSPAYGSTHGPL